MRAEDLFPAEAQQIDVGGVRVRKGTIAAFAHNALTLERTPPDSAEHRQALADLRAAIPLLRAAGLFEVFSLRTSTAARILAESERT